MGQWIDAWKQYTGKYIQTENVITQAQSTN